MSQQLPTFTPNKEEFGFSPTLRWIMLLCIFAFLVFAGLSAALPLVDPSHRAIGLQMLGVTEFGAFAVLGLVVLLKLWDTVVIDAEAISYIPRRGSPTVIAWADIATVTANDIWQRLVLVDVSGRKTIKLEYQLNNFMRLRSVVLSRTGTLVRQQASGITVFHRSATDRWVLLCGAIAIVIWQWVAHGEIRLAVAPLFTLALPLGAVFLAPLRLNISAIGVEITFLTRTRWIKFADISSVELSHVAQNGNAWAGVILRLHNGEQLHLSRFREGSLALHEALQLAWKDSKSLDGREALPDRFALSPFTVAFDLDLNDCLSHAWTVRPRQVQRLVLGNRASRVGVSFVFGLGLGFFHLNAACLVVSAAANALGFCPQTPPEYFHYLSTAPIVIGFIWFWLLAGASIQKFRIEAACRKMLRADLPELFWHSVPVSVGFSEDQLAFALAGRHYVIPADRCLELTDTDDFLILQFGRRQLPIPKAQLSPQIREAILNWSKVKNVFAHQMPARAARLPRNVSAGLGVTLCLACLWVGTHIRVAPKPAVFPTSVTLALPSVTTVIAGQTVHLDQVRYRLSDNQGVFFDNISGYINRPEISGTFSVDRNGSPYLARTAQAEFESERTWHLTIGDIPADATMEPLPDSGVFIAWDQPSSLTYPGHCGALRFNSGTTSLPDERVLTRNRLYLQVCSASMSKLEVKDWMMQAIRPLNHELVARTRNPN